MSTRSANEATNPAGAPALETARQDAQRVTTAWQDGIQAGWDAYRQQAQRAVSLTTTLFGTRAIDPERALQAAERIGTSTGEVLSAQAAVYREWQRAPLWLTGAASPADLPARYVKLLEANSALARAYLDAALVWRRAGTTVAASAAEMTREALSSQTQAVRTVADAAQDATSQVVEQARAVAEEAVQRAEHEIEQAQQRDDQMLQEAERERRQQERARQREDARHERQQAENERVARAARVIKAKVNGDGERIYHLPGQAGYDRVQAEQTFATEDEAQAAGFRRSLARGGGTVKGNISRDGERVYHLPGQANYDRIEAEMLFENEEQAQANGFRPSER